MVILTKIDEYYKKKLGVKKMDCPSSTLFSDGFAEEAVDEFMENSNNCISSRNLVLPCISYTGPYLEADEAIEALTIMNLNKIKNSALTFLRDYYKNDILIYNEKNEFLGHVKTSSIDAFLEKIKQDILKILLKGSDDEDISFDFLNIKLEKVAKQDESLKRIREIFVLYSDESIKCKKNPAIRIKVKNEEKEKKKPVKEEKKGSKNEKKTKTQGGCRSEDVSDEIYSANPDRFNITLKYGEQNYEINLLHLDLKGVFSQLLPSSPFGELIDKKPKKKPEGEHKKLIDFVEFPEGRALFEFEDPSEPLIYLLPYNYEYELSEFPFDMNLAEVRNALLEDGRINEKDVFFFMEFDKRIGKGQEKKVKLGSVLTKKGEDYVLNVDKVEKEKV